MPCDNCQCGDASGSTSVPLPKKASGPVDKVWSLSAANSGMSSARRSPSPSIRGRERDEQLQDILGDVQPLAKKCGADERDGHQCCRDLKGEDERHLTSPEIVRDVYVAFRPLMWLCLGSTTYNLMERVMCSRGMRRSWNSIIGLSDGLTVPFALTAGLSSLGSSSLVVTGGLAELCAGAISMGLGGYRTSLCSSISLIATDAGNAIRKLHWRSSTRPIKLDSIMTSVN